MDSADPRLQPDESFNYVDITNINTRWGMPTPMEMKGSDATSSRMRRVMREDTILVSTTRPTRNAIALVPDELDGQICSTGLAVLRCKAGIDMRYLFHMLRTRLMRMQLKRNCSGSGYPAINQEIDLPNIRIPFPSDTNQQSAIAGRIDEILDRAKSIEDRAKKHRQRAREAFESRILEEVGFTVPS
jgi:type I restriction enzyme S subunit